MCMEKAYKLHRDGMRQTERKQDYEYNRLYLTLQKTNKQKKPQHADPFLFSVPKTTKHKFVLTGSICP